MVVEYVDKREVLVNGGTSITIQIPAGASEGDLLIAYIAKDDNTAILETGDYADWNMLFNIISDSQTCLYVGWRIATAGDVSGAVSWTWNGDSEDWVGEILCYSGADTTNPIHASGSDYLDSSATPTAPSVSFTDLPAGSLVLQVFGCDFDDEPRTVPSQLTSRFNAHQATDIGGAGGDKSGDWVSPTGFDETGWTNEVNAYDENLTTYAIKAVDATSWGAYLELTINAINCSKVRTRALYNAAEINQISVDVYYSEGWHNIYEGAFANAEWVEHEMGSAQIVTKMRAKFYNADSQSHLGYFAEADFQESIALTGETGTAIFGIPASNEWTAATLVIEAVVAAGIFYKSLAGAFSSTGAITKLPKISLSGVLTSTGSIVKKTLLNLSGSFGLTGVVSSIFRFPKSLAGTFGLTGTVSKLPKITLAGVFGLTGTIIKLPKIILSGVFNPTGIVSSIRKSFQSLAGTFNLTGTVVKLPKISLSGAFDFTGSIARKILISLSGVFTGTGTIGSILKKFKSLAGTFDLTGTLAKKIYLSLSGVFDFSGSVSDIKKMFKSLTGVFGLTGTLGRLIKKGLVGAFDFAGDLASGLLGGIFYKSLAGAFTLTGGVSNVLTKFKSLVGSFNFSGSLNRLTKKVLSGVFSATGTVTSIFKQFVSLAGVFGLTGSIGAIKKAFKSLAGSFNFAGNIGKKIFISLAGVFNFTGSIGVVKKIFKTITGTFNLTGIVVKLPKITLSGTFNLTGTISRLIKKTLSGTFDFAGDLASQLIGMYYKTLSGAFDFTGSIVKLPKIILSGTFGFTGTLGTIKKVFKSLAGVFGLTGSLSRLIKRAFLISRPPNQDIRNFKKWLAHTTHPILKNKRQ